MGDNEKEGRKKTKEELSREITVLKNRLMCFEAAEYERIAAEDAIKKIAADAASQTGEKFFDSIVKQLAKVVEADFMFIGELADKTQNTIKTIALCIDGEIAPNIEYNLKDTPCDNVVGKRVCSFCSGVSKTFSKDILLEQMGVEGYVGVPLFDARDQPLGIMVGLFRRPMKEDRMKMAEYIFDFFSYRAALEIEHSRTESISKEKNHLIENSEKRYQLLFTQMINGYSLHEIICDQSGEPVDYRFIDINPAFSKLTGLTPDIIGKTVREVIPGIEEYWIEIYGDVALTGNSISFENYTAPLNKWYNIVAFSPTKNHFACIFEDITKRKQDEEELRHLRNFLSNIINSMPSVLIGVTPEGRITQWNQEAEKETGIPAEEAQGKLLMDLIPKWGNELKYIRRAIHERKPRKDEKVMSIKNGEPHFSDITIYPLIANGVEGAVIRIDDVTERVHIEEMMIQSEKMLTVGGLAAGMAHEINNPLAGIIQNIQVISNRLDKNFQKNIQVAQECGISMESIHNYHEKREIFSMMDSVTEAGRRAAKIVDNMLSFSRKSDTYFTPHDLRKLLDKTIELASNDYDLKRKYDFRQIEIIRDYDPNLPEILCDASQVQQVFLNLLKNGAHSMSERRKNEEKNLQPVEKSHFIFRIQTDFNDQIASIEIEDNGTGMEENILKRIFEPFFTTKTLGIGTGLGLSVSHFIITQNHGGTMKVNSEPGKGTKFLISLPFQKRGT